MAIGDTRINNFLDIFESFYIEYQEKLKKNGEIDFEDMINNASNAVREGRFKAPWEYIIIDEFQDCSWGQYRLLRNILHQSNKDKKKILGNNDNIQGPKLYCVGDDWQSIFRFAGADYNLMLDFRKYLGIKKFLLNSYTRINLDETFRFNDKIAYTSEKFILENKNQIKKNIKTTIKTNDPAVFLHWSSVSLDNKILNWLKDYSENKNYKNKNLMILFRYNFHEPSLEMKNIIRQKWKKNGSVDFKSCHKAKGLESDIVLLIDLQSGGNGFPSTKEDDPIIDLLLVKSDDYPFAEERRLFYVVLTRARFQTHLLCDSINISDFAKELRDEEKFKTVSRKQKSVDQGKAIPF